MSLPARVLPCTVRNEWRPGFDDRPMEPTGLPIDCQIPSITPGMEPPGSSVVAAATAHVIHPYSTWVCGRALRVEGFTRGCHCMGHRVGPGRGGPELGICE